MGQNRSTPSKSDKIYTQQEESITQLVPRRSINVCLVNGGIPCRYIVSKGFARLMLVGGGSNFEDNNPVTKWQIDVIK
jgi:hypothetical protein